MYENKRVYAIVVASGAGSRFGGGVPKQFMPLGGVPVVGHALLAFEKNPYIDNIILVSNEVLPQTLKISKCTQIIKGGKERRDSVFNGLQAIDDEDCIVIIHDGARPFVNDNDIARLLDAVKIHKAATLATPATNTLKVADGDMKAVSTLKREDVYEIQTPQAFDYKILMQAHKAAQKHGLVGYDDCQLVEGIGIAPKLVVGSSLNIKITYKIDLLIAQTILENKGEYHEQTKPRP
ncbi:MAG: 2-C-methyl-D-erythritol 4-phosphate cytidylyltransferase [Defluviitaleaceae bacterium]|nr:2-C-methyl-D-erythritol 4-phosphate cytidylyltransferase [Defluviitaleaceae bacterium]